MRRLMGIACGSTHPTALHRRSYAVGIDVDQAHDPTAICVASKIITTEMNPTFAELNPHP